LYPEDVTWEKLADILNQFPGVDLEDKVFLQGEGDVTEPKSVEDELMDLVNEELSPIPHMRAKRNKSWAKWLNNYQVPKKLQ